MKIIVTKDYEEMSEVAKNMIIDEVSKNRDIRLGLATGGTPLLTYKKIIEEYNQTNIDFSNVITFNLDEYVGLSPSDKNSYHYYMKNNLFNSLDIKKENTHIPNGIALDLKEECENYEKQIENLGGIDLQLLGIGKNAHIGFNEPFDVFASKTHVVELKSSTKKANAKYFEGEEQVPDRAISMGIGTIMRAKKIILLASGKSKAEAIKNTLLKDIDPKVPASILQLHPDVTFIIDEEAASLIVPLQIS